MIFDELSNKVINCAIEVHKNLGPGLLESAYEQCMSFELNQRGIPFKIQYTLPIEYKKIKIDCGYRIDILVDDKIIIELKSVDKILSIHKAQLLTYMKLAKINIGLLINFNVSKIKDGIIRFVI
ncbi:GxxExxY protein [candidate division WOR-3 bacterium]|nr:GxxExxY protein [candidate division WOR-3 bacterium]